MYQGLETQHISSPYHSGPFSSPATSICLHKILVSVSTVKINNTKTYLGTRDMSHLESLSILALFLSQLHLPT